MSLTLNETSTARTSSVATRSAPAAGAASSAKAMRCGALPRARRRNRAHMPELGIAMPKLIVEIAAASALTIAAIVALAAGAQAACSDVAVKQSFARASATPEARAGAAYFSLVNQSQDRVRVVSLASKRAASAMLHATETTAGTARMTEVAAVDVAPGETLELKPGGLHVMLRGLAGPLKRGESFDLTLTFADGCSVTTQVTVGTVAQTSAGG